jgi:hypothetical protein
MSYLFIKNLFQKEKSLYYLRKKLKIKKNKKTFLGGFFGWVFYCEPCLDSRQGPVGQPALLVRPLLARNRLIARHDPLLPARHIDHLD